MHAFRTIMALQGALRNTQLGVAVSALMGGLAAANVARLVAAAQTLVSAQGLLSMGSVAVAAFCWCKLRNLLAVFSFADYIHAEHD